MNAVVANTPVLSPILALRSPTLREDIKLAAILGLAAALATAAVFPYLLQLMPEKLAQVPLSLEVLVPLQALQAGVLLGLFALAGLRMTQRAGLRLPWLRAWIAGTPSPRFPWRLSIFVGVASALAILGLSTLTDPLLPSPIHAGADSEPQIGALAGFLASFYGGIGEELQLRLFLMTLVIWVLARIRGRAPGDASYWSGIAFAALLFGAGHLPAAAEVWPLDGTVVFRTMLLNGVAGVAFGWLYWKRGLETAMVAHFCADLVLHVAVPLVRLSFV